VTAKTIRTESREVWPFAHADTVFDTCALRLVSTEEFDAGRNAFALDDNRLDDAIEYEFQLDVDASALASSVRLDAKEIDVALILENDDGKRRSVLHRQPLMKLSRKLEGKIRPEEYSRRRLVLRLVAVLKSGRKANGNRDSAWRVGSVLAQRVFSLGPAPDTLFKVHWSPFAERTWEKDALSYVEVRDESLLGSDVEVDEVVQVHLNSDLPLLVAVWKIGATRDIRYGPFAASLRPLVAAEIVHEIALVVARHVAKLRESDAEFDLESMDPASLAAKVLGGLSRAIETPKEALYQEAIENPARLRVRIQHAVGVGRGFSRAVLERWEQP
jgi:hypothetical protein